MKKRLFNILLCLFSGLWLQGQVSYNLSYDASTATYTVSMRSGQTYTNGLARISSTTQIMIVAPHTTGGFQVTNLTDLQTGGVALDWGYSRIDAPGENPTKDYFFFSPNNSFAYTPFDIPTDTQIDLFSFQSGSGCLGTLNIMDTNDPFTTNTNFSTNNSIVIVGGGMNNLYQGSTSGNVSCMNAAIKYCVEYSTDLKAFVISMESAETFTGNLARLSSSSQLTVVFPHETGGFQISDVSNLQNGGSPLNWAYNRLDAPAENPNADYLFFAPSNAFTYTPFDITAGTKIPLFSFKLASECTGAIALYDNNTDPLQNNTQYSPDNNMVIIGAGMSNQYIENSCPMVSCSEACTINASTLSY